MHCLFLVFQNEGDGRQELQYPMVAEPILSSLFVRIFGCFEHNFRIIFESIHEGLLCLIHVSYDRLTCCLDAVIIFASFYSILRAKRNKASFLQFVLIWKNKAL